MCRLGGQHLLFAIDQPAGIKTGNFKTMPMRNSVRRTSLHTVPTKYTSIVIDIIDAGVALGAAHAVFGGVFGGFDVDAVRGAGGGAQETGYTLFQAIFVALENVHSAEAVLELGAFQRTFPVGIIFHLRGLEHLHEGDAHPFGDGRDVLQYRHTHLVYRMLQGRWPNAGFTARSHPFVKSAKGWSTRNLDFTRCPALD